MAEVHRVEVKSLDVEVKAYIIRLIEENERLRNQLKNRRGGRRRSRGHGPVREEENI
jgi:hypothetical protein